MGVSLISTTPSTRLVVLMEHTDDDFNAAWEWALKDCMGWIRQDEWNYSMVERGVRESTTD